MEDESCPWCGEPLSISKNKNILYKCRNFECSYIEYMYLNSPKVKAKGGKKLMTPTDIWNELVNWYNTEGYKAKETEIQEYWENLFEAFGYSKFWDEIDSHRSIQIGSTERVIPDIIIRQKQETSWQDCFLVELKCYTPKEDKHKQQLFSYLKQLKLDMGILVCDKIYLYDYNINKDDDNQSFFVIDFTKDNPDGIKFVELFSKNSFNKQNINAFIKNRNQEESDIKAIQQKVTTDFIHEILKEHLGSTYSPETIQKALEKIVITVGQKALKQQAAISLSATAIKPKKDHTQFLVDGHPTGGKCSTVRAVIKKYISRHPNISYSELKQVFPDAAAKPGFGKCIRLHDEVTPEEWRGNRFASGDLAHLPKTGEVVAISTQWVPANFNEFVKYAERAGFEVKPE